MTDVRLLQKQYDFVFKHCQCGFTMQVKKILDLTADNSQNLSNLSLSHPCPTYLPSFICISQYHSVLQPPTQSMQLSKFTCNT